MAPASVVNMHYNNQDQAMHSSACELKYERSAHLVDLITKDETIRKWRFEVHVLEDDCNELRDLLAQEEDRSDKLERIVNDKLKRAEEAEAALQDVEDVLQRQEQELSSLRAEAKALKNLTTDTSKIMTEKLELNHELSRIKPELEHLRAQVSANEGLLTEKLGFQRRVSTLEVELENAKRDAKRALAKRRNTMHEVQQEDELDSLRKNVTREKRSREKAEAMIEELRTELEEAKTSAQRNTVQETKKAEQDAKVEVRSEELSRELAQERKEKSKAEKALQKAQSDWEAQRAVLDDKLSQFRNKLRTTKEKLKESETALATAQAQTVAAPKETKKAAGATKGTKKRNAAQMEPDATMLGTPGDGAVKKRSRKVAQVGEKSSFSITPFLNRTMSIATESPQQEGDASEDEAAEAPQTRQPSASDAETSPTAKPKASTNATKKKTPLQPVPASKSNIKSTIAAQTKTTKIPLEKVIEEDEDGLSQAAPKSKPAEKPKPKMRKSLATFATFNLEPEPETKKKKRKLGGLGKTLFDEADDVPAKAMPGRGLFGASGRLGPLSGLGAAAKGSFLVGGMGTKKKGLMSTEDGFQFSPLKKQRGGASFLK